MVILIGSQNYLAWKRETKFYLAGKGLAGHIDGTTIQPMKARAGNGGEDKTMEVDRESAEWMAWFKEDMRCITKIRMRIAPMIRGTIGDDLCTAKELWELLESRYGRTSGYSRALAMRNIVLCQMRRDRSVAVHMSNVTRLVAIARQYGCHISYEDEAYFLVLNLDAKFTSMSLFSEINEKWEAHDVENLKRRIEDEERCLSDLHSLKRFQPVAQTPSNSLLSDDTELILTRVRCFKCHGYGHKTPECPSAECFDEDGTPRQQQH
ncbi:unnamed protein product, partial [Aphanomyces euteiches]